MAEDRADARSGSYLQSATWTELLTTFQVALDPKKLLLAAAGIVTMSLGWWLLSMIFYSSFTRPNKDDLASAISVYQKKDSLTVEQATAKADIDFQRDLKRWELLNRLAGPNGKLSTMPWFEDRGPNPFLFGTKVLNGTSVERRENVSWFLTNQVPVLVEPLVKFITPVVALLDPSAGFWIRVYLFLCILWMLAVWAFFGGVITRLAVVQLAGKDQVNFKDTLKFVASRYLSYLFSPLVPLAFIGAVAFGCILFGILHAIPYLGDIVDLAWPLILGAGVVMTILLVGLIGYPLMYTTLSSEGSDTFDALSRSYNYVYQSPWAYLWYSFVAVVYGAVLIFFVVFMSSLTVYLGKWGVSQAPLTQTTNRVPDYLFIYSPTSFGWRELLTSGSDIAIQPTLGVSDPTATPAIANTDAFRPEVAGYRYVNPDQAKVYVDSIRWNEYAAAGVVSLWVILLFLLMLGFSYSYFWTASSMIYLLMRKKVDETEIDEIYTEDEDLDTATIAPPRPPVTTPNVTMVEAPTLRTPPPTPVVPPPVVVPPVVVTPPVVTPPPVVVPPVVPPEPPVVPPVVPPVIPPVVTPPTTPEPPPVTSSEPEPEPKKDDGEPTL